MKIFESNGNNFTIKVNKAPVIIRIVLWAILIVSILIPIVSIGFSIYLGNGLKATYFLTLLFFFGVSFFIYRIAAWNSFGKEQYEVTPHELNYYADYKLFTQAERSIPLDEVELKYVKTGYIDENKGVMQIKSTDPEFLSSIRLPEEDINKIINELKRAYKL